MLKTYICGQVTGLDPAWVRAKFDAITRTVEGLGYTPVNPVELVNDFEMEWRAAMKICLGALMDCHAIYVQEDWHRSRGARIEIMTAHELDLIFLFENPMDIQAVAALKNRYAA
jgi:hypothetical protein